MLKLKHQYFGHLMWRADSLKKTLMLGKIEGRRRRGTTKDEMVGWCHWLKGHECEPAAGDGVKEAWRAAVLGAAMSWTQQRDWTAAKMQPPLAGVGGQGPRKPQGGTRPLASALWVEPLWGSPSPGSVPVPGTHVADKLLQLRQRLPPPASVSLALLLKGCRRLSRFISVLSGYSWQVPWSWSWTVSLLWWKADNTWGLGVSSVHSANRRNIHGITSASGGPAPDPHASQEADMVCFADPLHSRVQGPLGSFLSHSPLLSGDSKARRHVYPRGVLNSPETLGCPCGLGLVHVLRIF